jgi:glycosyltransferase involved in cell wall biosynthesis
MIEGTDAGSRVAFPPSAEGTRDPGMPDARRPVVGLVAHDPAVPSFRLRMTCLLQALAAAGLDARVVALGRGREFLRVVRLARQWRTSDLLVFQQVKLLAGERAFVARLCPTWVLDVDDAIMFARPRKAGQPPRQGVWRQRRFRRMTGCCRVVVTGSRSLAGMVGNAAGRLETLPTPVDLRSYPVAAHSGGECVRLAWIGLGSNLRYLEALAPVLRRLHTDGFPFELRVVCDRLPEASGFPCSLVRWSVEGEGAALAGCDLGLAPLDDDAWTRGKSGYRCVQYAAAGLPTLASPVGANREVVRDGETGLFASTQEEWRSALQRLCRDAAARRAMGAAARARATEYDLSRYAERYVALLRGLL